MKQKINLPEVTASIFTGNLVTFCTNLTPYFGLVIRPGS